MQTSQIGSEAEQAVAEQLTREGYTVHNLNWKTQYAEIDIVAEKKGVMFFTEVKYRRTASSGDGFDYITPVKLHHMQRAAELWVSMQNWKGEYVLLAASVTGEGGFYQIDIREIT